jgi:creatinine amidohydrolase/Fe(II)-dependent formamide hydrolase-like protein
MDKVELNLKDKMGDWGPFGKNEGKWGLFTVGNPNEGHGPALPRMLDDMHAKYIAHRVEFLTGARYIAHIPYTTDQSGPIAKNWSPNYVPEPIFIENLISFTKFHLETLQKLSITPKYLLIILGHGGVRGLLSKEQLLLDHFNHFGIEKVYTRFIFDPSLLPQLPQKYHSLAKTVGHACNVEHSLAAAMGVLDHQKFAQLNQELKTNFDATVRKYPPLVGLGGYLLAGEDYLTEIQAHKKGEDLWRCYNSTRQLGNDQLIADPEFGKAILDIAIKNLISLIIN